jgi:cytochrome c553
VLGCTGCHGKELQGKRFYELYASNLTRDVHQYSDDQLELLLRTGQRPDARDVWGMPSEIFQHMSAPDMKALVFHLRTLRPSGAPTQPRLPFEAETKKLIAEGTFMPAAQAVQKARSRVPVDLGPPHALGRYVTMVTCAECHGSDLSGGIGTPDLVAASAYTREEFDALMSKGVPNGPRKLELMADVAKERFSRFTPAERNAVYAYLRARAERPQ